VTPTDIGLKWRARDKKAAGRVVEFATERQGPYTALEFLTPRQTSYTHPELIPDTPFFYRLRAFYGPVSKAVEVTLPEGSFDGMTQQSDHDWTAPTTTPGQPAATTSVTRGGGEDAAAPADLSAVVMHANGIRFRWTDRATDEEGQLLEVKPVAARNSGWSPSSTRTSTRSAWSPCPTRSGPRTASAPSSTGRRPASPTSTPVPTPPPALTSPRRNRPWLFAPRISGSSGAFG
jgi:hypothetical protein